MIELPVPFTGQSRNSAACGTCSIKMALDYYQQIKGLKIPALSTRSLTQKLKVSKAWGMQENEAKFLLKQFGLIMRPIKLEQIEYQLLDGHPILALFADESLDGHYALIKGLDREKDEIIFQDPYPEFGAGFRRKIFNFERQIQAFAPENLWAILPE